MSETVQPTDPGPAGHHSETLPLLGTLLLPLKPDGPRSFGWRDWLSVAIGTGRSFGQNEISLIAAGVAFYGFLAIFPMIAALVALYGFLSDPATIESHLEAAADWAPPGAVAILNSEIESIVSAGRSALGYASILTLALTLWTAKNGVSALIRGLNIVFKVRQRRGVVTGLALAYGLTLALVVVAILALGAVVILPSLLAAFPVQGVTDLLLRLGRWPIVLGAVLFGIGLLYHFGPAERRRSFSWISVGAVLAIALWLAGSAGFSYYVRNFAGYNATYGSLGAIVGLLMWLYLSALIILLGGEINAQIEFRMLGEPQQQDATSETEPTDDRAMPTTVKGATKMAATGPAEITRSDPLS
ncbi:MAG: YihY/virulence factor BrkB family protein [Pseudomonadota bacterium]